MQAHFQNFPKNIFDISDDDKTPNRPYSQEMLFDIFDDGIAAKQKALATVFFQKERICFATAQAHVSGLKQWLAALCSSS